MLFERKARRPSATACSSASWKSACAGSRSI